MWVPLPDPAPGSNEPIYVSFPAPPDEEALSEATHHLKCLEANGQIARGAGQAPPGATYLIETDDQGRRRLVRKRFAAR